MPVMQAVNNCQRGPMKKFGWRQGDPLHRHRTLVHANTEALFACIADSGFFIKDSCQRMCCNGFR